MTVSRDPLQSEGLPTVDMQHQVEWSQLFRCHTPHVLEVEVLLQGVPLQPQSTAWTLHVIHAQRRPKTSGIEKKRGNSLVKNTLVHKF